MLSFPAARVSITQRLPRHVRAGGFGLIYSGSIAMFGGSTQFNTDWLTRHRGNPLVPAWYMLGAMGVGLIGLPPLPETAPVRAGRAGS